MAANPIIDDIPEDEHPALLLVRAHELAQEAEKLVEKAKAKRMEAAKLRAKAERLRDGAHLAPAPRPRAEPTDPLLGAAGIAIEDLGGTWQPEQLGELLGLRDRRRVEKIVSVLESMELVLHVEDGWRTIDPDEARVRDAMRKLGTGSPEQLAEAVGLPVSKIGGYVELGQERGWLDVSFDGHLMFLRPGPERIITRHPHRRPPEKEPPAYLDAAYRGEPVRVVHHGKRGGAMSNPGQRHRIKLRDKAREKQETARAERAEQHRKREQARKQRKK